MSRILAVLALALLAPAGAARAEGVDPACVRLLPPPEVEKVAGVKPLELVDRTAVRFANGTCNYAKRTKKERALVLLLTVIRDTRAEELEQLRSVAVKPRPAKGLSVADAFQAAGLVGFRKGTTIVSLGALVDSKTGERWVSDAELLELAKRVASRL